MRRVAPMLLIAAAVVALSACSTDGAPVDETPAPALSATNDATGGATGGATAAPSDANADRAAFVASGESVAATRKPRGRDFVDALVAAGYPLADMQLTSDTTAIGLDASGIEYSLLVDGQCLIGQWGADLGYRSIVVEPLATGRCLVGSTVDLSS